MRRALLRSVDRGRASHHPRVPDPTAAPSRASTLTPAATPKAWSSAILQVTAVVDALERRLDAAD
jgi:hypothetical protein